ncbi:MAG TPA: hypothetical protein VJI75_05940 [Candidatus Nanoarchaeia archaeon]|nr:hypothetical protein [Candidatus Nanoarchaeia archaeon]
MDIRKVQKTGNMHYLYLPTSWCKEQKISSGANVTLDQQAGGRLIVTPGMVQKKVRHIEITSPVDDIDVINKLIVSCFINPADSFTIGLMKEMNYTELLNQKRLVSVDMVELEGKTIKCESPVSISSPDLLLKTMISKITNMLMVMTSGYNEELIRRYEEEIDKSRLLIDKATIAALTYTGTSTVRTISMHYISIISKELERVADHLIKLDKANKKFFEDMISIMHDLKPLIENAIDERIFFDYLLAVKFAMKVRSLGKEEVNDVSSYSRSEIGNRFDNISEVMLDWAITRKVT